jgi:hypothetical protein
MEMISTATITSYQYHAKPKNIKNPPYLLPPILSGNDLKVWDKESLGMRCEVGVRPL